MAESIGLARGYFMNKWRFVGLFLSLSTSVFSSGSTRSDWEKRLTERLSEFQSCQDQTDDKSPCNRFVGRALSDVYGIDDFKDPGTPGQYISANLMETYVVTHNDVWVLLGDASDQKVLDEAAADANQGHAVIAAQNRDTRTRCTPHITWSAILFFELESTSPKFRCILPWQSEGSLC